MNLIGNQYSIPDFFWLPKRSTIHSKEKDVHYQLLEESNLAKHHISDGKIA